MAFNKKCTCEVKNSNKYCRICSRIIMKIMLKHQYKHLKVVDPITGKKVCPAWYSFYSKNGKSDQKIKADMITRLEASEYANTYNVLIFIDNSNPYAKYKPIMNI
jgi:hypothetical protein